MTKRSYVGHHSMGGWCVYWYDPKTDAWHEGKQYQTKRGAAKALREDRARSAAAAMLGSLGGSSTSERKIAASRENGKRGGRPKSTQ